MQTSAEPYSLNFQCHAVLERKNNYDIMSRLFGFEEGAKFVKKFWRQSNDTI